MFTSKTQEEAGMKIEKKKKKKIEKEEAGMLHTDRTKQDIYWKYKKKEKI